MHFIVAQEYLNYFVSKAFARIIIHIICLAKEILKPCISLTPVGIPFEKQQYLNIKTSNYSHRDVTTLETVCVYFYKLCIIIPYLIKNAFVN